MPTVPDEDIPSIRQRLLGGMKSYKDAAGDGCSYTEDDIQRCNRIVDEYLVNLAIDNKLSQDRIRDEVKKAVIDLNTLNEACDGSLIETDQREDLCELLLLAAKQAGLATDDDITEEWREW